ncbi:ferredoxin--nitrite reductase [Sulfurisphaera javensis]|uniref:Ferredoxin--nitrite reductase n=1 Tax=Sulfurisphaera javensis TaxID=2049879 RepID=A0AAT9GSW5_9CREN
MKYSEKFKQYYPIRFKGIYTSRGDNDLVSVRIRQANRRDPSKWYTYQLEALVKIASTMGNGKIHFTTRGDVELYGISASNLNKVLEILKEADLDPQDSCGASVRNVMPCPSYLCPFAKTNAVKVAMSIAELFRHNQEYEYPKLPKRVKITVSACEIGCATPGIMDVGIVAKGEDKFDVYIGGGIGDHEFQSVKLFENVSAREAMAISIAVADLLKQENEKRGFKWVLNKYGEEKTKELINEKIKELENKLEIKGENPDYLNYVKIIMVRTTGGWLTTDQVNEIIKVAKENYDFVVLFNMQTIFIPLKKNEFEIKGVDYEVLDSFPPKIRLVEACIGDDYCPPAVLSTTTVAENIEKILKEKGSKLRVYISGCSHSCGRHQIADIGLGAAMKNGKKVFKVYVGGGNYKIGKMIGEIDAEDYVELVDKISDIKNFDEQALTEKIKEIKSFRGDVNEEK